MERETEAKSVLLLPMSENNRFYFCNILYILPYDASYILVFWSKIKEKKNMT